MPNEHKDPDYKIISCQNNELLNKITITELFEFQAMRHASRVALVFGEREITYQELNEKSNQLARYIRSQFLKRTGNELNPDTLIALCLDRGIELAIGILGVLKAGGAYVPMDPSYPQERIDYLILDTGAEFESVLVRQK